MKCDEKVVPLRKEHFYYLPNFINIHTDSRTDGCLVGAIRIAHRTPKHEVVYLKFYEVVQWWCQVEAED